MRRNSRTATPKSRWPRCRATAGERSVFPHAARVRSGPPRSPPARGGPVCSSTPRERRGSRSMWPTRTSSSTPASRATRRGRSRRTDWTVRSLGPKEASKPWPVQGAFPYPAPSRGPRAAPALRRRRYRRIARNSGPGARRTQGADRITASGNPRVACTMSTLACSFQMLLS